MNKRQAKKIAYFRASRILSSTLACGWHPNYGLDRSQYSETDSNRILEALNEICINLADKSQDDSIKQLKKDGLLVDRKPVGEKS